MVSAITLVNGSTTPQNVLAGATVNVALQNSAGVTSWTLVCTSTDELNTVAAVNATISISQVTFSGTFTMPSTASGSAVQLTSTVNPGSNQVSSTLGVFVLDPLGTRLFFPGETNESSAQFGVIADLNALGRSTISVPNATATTPGAIQLTKDLGGTYNAPLVVGIQGNPVKAITLGASQDGYVPVWVNADTEIEFKSLASVVVDEATTTALGTVQLAGDLGGTGTVGTAPTVGSLTGNASNVVVVAGTTPTIQSNTSATSMTIGTKKTGASLVLQGDNAISGITLSGAENGIVSFSGALDGYVNTIPTTTDYVVDGYGVNDYIILSAYSATHIIHLPAPTTGRILTIKDVGGNLSPTVIMKIGQHASEQIEGLAATYNVTSPFACIKLTSGGTNWHILG